MIVEETHTSHVSTPTAGSTIASISHLPQDHMPSEHADAFQLARTPRPTVLPPLPGLDLHALYYSARTGGDFFDAVVIGNRVVFLLTDIAGPHDLAYPIAASIQDALHQHAAELFTNRDINLTDSLATLAHRVNQTIIQSHGTRFSPTFLGCFDLSLGLLAYINAGGQPAIFRDTDGTRTLGAVTVPLGLFTHITFEPAVQAFEPGAHLLLVTKGVPDASRGRRHFGVDRLLHLLQNFSPGAAFDLCKTALHQAHTFRKLPWYSLQRLPFFKSNRVEDLTAVALVRPHTT
jgi:serine phosphatase RsbU (regulator of sigma subunit)